MSGLYVQISAASRGVRRSTEGPVRDERGDPAARQPGCEVPPIAAGAPAGRAEQAGTDRATLRDMDQAIDDTAFEDWVFDAIDALPAAFRERLGSVAIVIEE